MRGRVGAVGSVGAPDLPGLLPFVVPSIQLEADALSGPAPLSVAFRVNATAIDLRREHTLTTFGDAGATFDRLPVDMPWDLSANRSNSPYPVHTFEAPGTYTVSTTVTTREGLTYTDSLTVTVDDPDAAFPGTQTLVVSPSGNYAGAPAGADPHLTFDDAIAAIPTGLSARETNYRILLRAGETHVKADITADLTTAREGFYRYVGRFGDPAAADPVLDFTAVTGNRRVGCDAEGTTQWSNINLVGPWDETAANLAVAVQTFGIDISGIGKHGIHNCRSNGFSTGIRGFDDGDHRIIVTNTVVENWKDYAIKVGHCRGGVHGVSMLRSPDANGNGAPDLTDPLWFKTHGGMRLTSPVAFSIELIDSFQNSGWEGVSGIPSHQATVRFNTNGDVGCSGYIGKVRSEGGREALSLYASGGGAVSQVTPMLVEDCLLSSTANTDCIIRYGHAGVWLRNIVGIFPDVPKDQAGLPAPMFQHEYESHGDLPYKQTPIVAEMIQLVDLRNEINSEGVAARLIDPAAAAAEFFDFRISNSARFAPNRAAPQIADGPFDARELLPPKYKGLQFTNPNASQALDVAFATPAGSISLYQPAPGAGVLDAATGSWPSFDLLGNPRGVTTATGAYATFVDPVINAALPLPVDFGVNLYRDEARYYTDDTAAARQSAFTGSTVYVDAAGDDITGDGSAGAPYATLDAAIAAAAALDTISIAAGAYDFPSSPISKSLAFIPTGGFVVLGEMTNLSGVAFTATTFSNVFETAMQLGGFVRTDAVGNPYDIRGAAMMAQSYGDAINVARNQLFPMFFESGPDYRVLVDDAGTIAEFDALRAQGNLYAWAPNSAQQMTVSAGATVFLGPNMILCSAATVLTIEGGAEVIADRSHFYSSAESIVVAAGVFRQFGARCAGSQNNGIDYAGSGLGVEVDCEYWNCIGNCSTAHASSDVLRIGGRYGNSNRQIRDVQIGHTFVFSATFSQERITTTQFLGYGKNSTQTPPPVETRGAYGDLTFIGTSSDTAVGVFDTSDAQQISLTDAWPYVA